MDSSPKHKYDVVIFSGTCANCCWPGLPAKSGKWLHVVQVSPWWVIFREGGILKANSTRAILNFLYLVGIYPYIELARASSVLQNSLLSVTAVSAMQGNTSFTFKSTLCSPEEATGEQKLSLSNLRRGWEWCLRLCCSTQPEGAGLPGVEWLHLADNGLVVTKRWELLCQSIFLNGSGSYWLVKAGWEQIEYARVPVLCLSPLVCCLCIIHFQRSIGRVTYLAL